MRRSIALGVVVGFMLTAAGAVAEQTEVVKGKPALIVMDMQNAFIPWMDAGEVKRATPMINATIAAFRAQGLPVIRVYHTSTEGWPAQGSEGFDFVADIQVTTDDPKVVKNHPSAFKQTELAALLGELGCDTVFLCGMSSVGCVLATYFDAAGMDLEVFMVRGGLISHKPELTAAVEEITGAVGYSAIKYMAAHAPR